MSTLKELADKILTLPLNEQEKPCMFVEPYDTRNGFEAVLVQAELTLTCESDDPRRRQDHMDISAWEVEVLFRCEGKVYGKEVIWVEASDEAEAGAAALDLTDNSQYADSRVDFTRTTTVLDEREGECVIVRKGDWYLAS